MPDDVLWARLAGEGRLEVLEKLQHVERSDAGYGTIVVPAKGFSDSDRTHNCVIEWLRKKNVNVLNIRVLEARMELALHGQDCEEAYEV